MARQSGDLKLAQALINAVLALDPGNEEAASLLAGPAPRRQMTLLFCDIVGSTQLADALDPEDVSFLLRAYRATCADVVERFGGFIDDHRGDGMLVLFGYPQVHEDDARRAVQCSLAIIKTLKRRVDALTEDLGVAPLRVRIAVHTDLVVLDGVGVAGATANETARIQDFAEPDTVVMSYATKALVWPWFVIAPLGEVALRGVSRRVELFTVLSDRPKADATTMRTRSSPFVGRDRELHQLVLFMNQVGERIGSFGSIVVSGPAGVGKTRLAAEVARRLDLRNFECTCSRFHQNTSLHAFRPLIEAACGIDDDDTPEVRLIKLRASSGHIAGPAQDLPFLAGAIDIPLTMLSPPVDVEPGLLRQRALEMTRRLLRSVAQDGPLLMIIDDLQWADQSTIDLLTMMIEDSADDLRFLITTREGFDPPWPSSLVSRLNLEPLDRKSMAELASLMPEGAALSAEGRDELIERSDGIPLFLEELLRTADAVENGKPVHRSVRFSDHHIPPALRDPLLARLASPQVDLELAQVAATIGRDVECKLLQQVVNADEMEFKSRLNTLFAAGLVESTQDGIVRFRHELIREVAYETQRRSVLWKNHSAIADLLRGEQDVSPRISAEVADHLENAHRYDEAIEAHLQVAKADQAVGAHVEATHRLTHTLEILGNLPPGGDRQRTELAIRGLRSFSAVMSGGYAAKEAAEDYPRCVDLCEILHTSPEIVPSLIRSWSYYAFRSDLVKADAVLDTLVRQASIDSRRLPVEHVLAGVDAFFHGDFPQARQRLELFAASELAMTPDRPPPEWPLPNDALVAVCAHLAPVAWITGDSGEALRWAEQGLERANSLIFPYGAFSVCYVVSMLALTRNIAGDYEGAAKCGMDLVEMGNRHGFALWTLTGAIQVGISSVHQGHHDALDQLAENVSTWRFVLAADAWTTYWLTELAGAQRAAGRDEDALRSLDAALAIAAETGCRFYLSQTLIAAGRLRIDLGDPSGLGKLREAADVARTQGAVMFERRASAVLLNASKLMRNGE